MHPGEQTQLSLCAESHASVQHSGEGHTSPAVVLATFPLFRGLDPFLLCQDTYFLKKNAYFVFKLEGTVNLNQTHCSVSLGMCSPGREDTAEESRKGPLL